MPRIALVTCAALADLHEDDRPLVGLLAARGVEARAAIWDDPAVDWGSFAAAVVRTTWDYHQKHAAWLAWTARVEGLTRVWNPPAVLRWNSHKGYLAQLAREGAPVVPTVHAAAGAGVDLAALGWEEMVVKPAVSAGARDTYRVRGRTAEVEALMAARDVLIQPYLPSVETYGERSLVFLGGRFSHAIRKHPMLLGGAAEGGEPRVAPAEDELATAGAVLARVREPLLYARVDLARDASGRPLLMELEVIEPRLFFFAAPEAREAFADAIACFSSTNRPSRSR